MLGTTSLPFMAQNKIQQQRRKRSEKLTMSSTQIEKENLEAHVELCAERYKQLETKLSDMDSRMTKVEAYLVEIKESITDKTGDTTKTIITIGTTIVGVMFTAIISLLIHLANK
jgi:predicted transcriptional regulator